MDPGLMNEIMLTFGPVPSRRLGRSIGINNIPPKICTYSCIYCQVGRTHRKQIRRNTFYEPQQIFHQVKRKIDETFASGESIDYLTFVPDGEPTLDANLGISIDLLKPLGFGIAVITNASLLSRDDVKNDLMKADWVSIKIDSTREKRWRKINRPHRNLHFSHILNGILEFAKQYKGILTTETMLVGCPVEDEARLRQTAKFIRLADPATAYLSIPTRPPAESNVGPPGPSDINKAFQIFEAHIERVEYLIGYEGDAFASTGNATEDLLSITAVHPMREDAVIKLLENAGTNFSVIDKFVRQGKIITSDYNGHTFYMRNLRMN